MRRRGILTLAAPFLIVLLALPAVGETTPTPTKTKRKRTPTKTPAAVVTPAAAAASAPAPPPPASPTAAPAAKAAAAPTAAPKPAASGASSADVGAGKALYDKNCKKCHGALGEGVARMYALVDAKIVHLGSKQAQSKSDAEIVKSITDGVGKMEAVEDVTPAQARQMTAFMRTLKIE